MPSQPARPCNAHGCGALTVERYCSVHRKQHYKTIDTQRPTALQRGYGYKWQKARATYLAKHPLCITCEAMSIVTPANVVDHIIPHKGDTTLFWETKNWQPLCKQCHDIKTAGEAGTFGRHMR